MVLRSMTGFGQAQRQRDDCQCAVEIRSINNRFLKIAAKLPDTHCAFESRLEKRIRAAVHRGTVSVSLRIDRPAGPARYRLNRTVMEGYLAPLREMKVTVGEVIGFVLALPGVVEELPPSIDTEADWSLTEETLNAALTALEQMRCDEGDSMRLELLRGCRVIDELVERIETRMPATIQAYRDRLCERVNALLTDRGVSVNVGDLIKEVAIYTERSDVGEEITRIRSHLAQFQEILDAPQSEGRKLEFVTQEMYREANTLGSKAIDTQIGQWAVEVKCQVERIREIIQNVE